jgi:hypothetical protein
MSLNGHLKGMITGLGRVCLLSGRIRRYRIDLPALRGCAPAVRCAAAPAGWAVLATRGRRRSAGSSRSQPNRLEKIENPVSFSNLFYKFQTNLNSNQI